MNIAERIAEFTLKTDFNSLPDAVIHEAKRTLLEAIATMVLGSNLKLGWSIGNMLAGSEGTAGAFVVGRTGKLPLETAALYNTAIADVPDSTGGYYRGTVHPGKNVVPASLTTVSYLQKSGRDLILAIVLGTESYYRLDLLIGGPHSTRGHYTNGTLGTIGSAVSVGKLFGLDKNALAGALGSAAMMAPCTVGGKSMFRSIARPLAIGQSSVVAITAVKMAQARIFGPTDIFECSGGFCMALSGVDQFDHFQDDFGETWECLSSYKKPFAGCRLSHLARQGARDLRNKYGIKAEDIAQVVVKQAEATLTVVGHHANIRANVVEHSCSAPYLMANVFLYGDLGPDVLSEERMNDRRVHELAERISIIGDPALTARWAREHCRGGSIEVTLKDGRVYSYFQEHLEGDPVEGWQMSDEALEDKLRFFTRGMLESHEAEEVIRLVRHLDELDNLDRLVACLATDRHPTRP